MTKLGYDEYAERVMAARGSHIKVHALSYRSTKKPVTFTCELHGVTLAVAADELLYPERRMPCAECYEIRRETSTKDRRRVHFDRILKEIQEKYKDKPYTYELAEESYFAPRKRHHYTRMITVTCKMPGHGPFTKERLDHLNHSGCPKCYNKEARGTYRRKYHSTEELVDAIQRVNRLGLDLSRVELQHRRNTKQWIKCGCGWRQSRTDLLLAGGGCQRCSANYMWQQRRNGAYVCQRDVGPSESEKRRVTDVVQGKLRKLRSD